MSLTLKLALGPLLLAQALHTRRVMPRLPEAAGPREGVAAPGPVGRGEAPPGPAAPGAPMPLAAGEGGALRLLIVGDSSAAGVGVATQDEALAGCLARALARTAGRPVHWQLRARSGVTSAGALALLQEAPLPAAEVAVLVTGVNDVIDQVPPRAAIAARAALLQALGERAGVRHTVLTPLPPMHRFVGLPQPLRWIAGRDASAHGRALARWAEARPDASLLQADLPLDPALLATDGFHPGPAVYRHWGDALAAHIVCQALPRLR